MRKNLKTRLVALGLSCIMPSIMPISSLASPAGSNSMMTPNYGQVFSVPTFEKKDSSKGWKFENGTWFLYDKNGHKRTGWYNDDGLWYYLNTANEGVEGSLHTGWLSQNGKTYFLNPKGFDDGSSSQYVNTAGAMEIGWVNINNFDYYFNADGSWDPNKGMPSHSSKKNKKAAEEDDDDIIDESNDINDDDDIDTESDVKSTENTKKRSIASDSSIDKASDSVIKKKGKYIEVDTGNAKNKDNKFLLIDSIDHLSGTLNHVDEIESFRYTITFDNQTVKSGEIEVNEYWTIDDVGFALGENVVSLKAYADDKILDDVDIEFFNLNLENTENIDLDTSDNDGDGIPAYIELYANTDPDSDDTDGDGISDMDEIQYTYTDPTKEDTDKDGINDFDDDEDEDGLSNGRELELGTDPRNRDSDYDGIDDDVEISEYGTDPINRDTDGDGAEDGWEIKNGYDPLAADSSFTVEILAPDTSEGNPVTAGVSVDIVGSAVESVDVEPVSFAEHPYLSSSLPGFMGAIYDFTADSPIESATLTFNYDVSTFGTLSDDFQPRIYYINENNGGALEELENQTIEEGRVTGETSHFSPYVLLNSVTVQATFDSLFNDTDAYDEFGNKKTTDIVFAIDSSGSMKDNDKSGLRLQAVNEFIDNMQSLTKAAIVDFDYFATLRQGLTDNNEYLHKAVKKVDAYGGTDLSAGIKRSLDVLKKSDADRKYIIFLTDGDGGYKKTYTQRAKDEGVTIYTIGLGKDVKDSVLKEIAEGTGGKYFFAEDASLLGNIYEDLSIETLVNDADDNHDGILDAYEKAICEGRIRPRDLSAKYIGCDFSKKDPNNPASKDDDYDNDGLINGDEISIIVEDGKVFIEENSNPTRRHSDFDGIDDLTEVESGTDPMKVEYNRVFFDNLFDDSSYAFMGAADDYFNSKFQMITLGIDRIITGVEEPKIIYQQVLMQHIKDTYDNNQKKNYEHLMAKCGYDAISSLQFSFESELASGLSSLYTLGNIPYSVVDLGMTSNTAINAAAPEICAFMTKSNKFLDSIVESMSGAKTFIPQKQYTDLVYEAVDILPDMKVAVNQNFKISKYLSDHLRAVASSEVYETFMKNAGNKLYALNEVAYGMAYMSRHAEVWTSQNAINESMDLLHQLKINGDYAPIREAAANIEQVMKDKWASVITNNIKSYSVSNFLYRAAVSKLSGVGGVFGTAVAVFVATVAVLDITLEWADTIKDQFEMYASASISDGLKLLIYDDLKIGDDDATVTDDALYIPDYIRSLAYSRVYGTKSEIDVYMHRGTSALFWFSEDSPEDYAKSSYSAVYNLVISSLKGMHISSDDIPKRYWK